MRRISFFIPFTPALRNIFFLGMMGIAPLISQAQEKDVIHIDTSGEGRGVITQKEEEPAESRFTYRWEQPNGGGPAERQLRRVSPTAVNRLKGDKSFWYMEAQPDSAAKINAEKDEQRNKNKNDKVRKTQTEKNSSSSSSGGIAPGLLWFLVVVAFGGLIIWYLANSNVKLFQRRSRKFKTSATADLSEMPEDIFRIPYLSELDKAIAAGNYRMAIRLLYLQVLKRLADKNKIRYRQEATNADYLSQLYNTPLYKDFFRVTRHYEYSWYGQFPVSEQVFKIVREEFNRLEGQI